MVPRKPRLASSKSRVSENGSAFSVAACCAMTGAEACLGISLSVSGSVVWVMLASSLALQIHETGRPISPELQPFELAGAAPGVDIFEIGHRAGGMADIQLGGRTRLASLIVVVAGRAVRRADHPADAGQEQLDP